MYILQIENLYKKYDKTEVINNVSFSIKEGEIYGLLGPNGAGKSTIIKLIAGIEQLDKGKIIFEEKETNVNKYKKNLGIVAQDIALYPNFTAYENISFFCSLYSFKGKELKKHVENSLEFVGLKDYKNKKAKEFSGGMMRRLHLACAIAHNPKLIIMDEPTLGIDPEGMRELLALIRQLSEEDQRTILISSHQLHQVQQICDRVGIFVKGKLIACGSVGELAVQLQSEGNYILI